MLVKTSYLFNISPRHQMMGWVPYLSWPFSTSTPPDEIHKSSECQKDSTSFPRRHGRKISGSRKFMSRGEFCTLSLVVFSSAPSFEGTRNSPHALAARYIYRNARSNRMHQELLLNWHFPSADIIKTVKLKRPFFLQV